MSTAESIKQLEELIEHIQAYIDLGKWDVERHGEILDSMDRAKSLFGSIIDSYIDSADKPALDEAYAVSNLQEKLHHFEHSLPIPPPVESVSGDTMDKKVVVYTTPT